MWDENFEMKKLGLFLLVMFSFLTMRNAKAEVDPVIESKSDVKIGSPVVEDDRAKTGEMIDRSAGNHQHQNQYQRAKKRPHSKESSEAVQKNKKQN